MSYGTDRHHATKKALREDIEARGAENVGVYGTSFFGNETAANIAELADSPSAVIVGPDVERNRKWYANVVRKPDGTITIK